MDSITLKNFRCFREEQTARLAPLTLLVGENSTGKTSFLALIRALWDVAYRHLAPDFKEEPYDLGSFDEVAHHRGGRGGRADAFQTGFEVAPTTRKNVKGADNSQFYRFDVTFENIHTAPHPVQLRLAGNGLWAETLLTDGRWAGRCGTPTSTWTYPAVASGIREGDTDLLLSPYYMDISVLPKMPEPAVGELEMMRRFLSGFYQHDMRRPYANAPVRSKPRRTYDPTRATRDPEGDYVPMLLAGMYFQESNQWAAFQNALVEFGRAAGLFDEIAIKRLGRRDTEPFQIRIRIGGKRIKGPARNLTDVGYGVSQVLPVITELLRPDAPSMFLLQQPEVHLHPRAQAALGTLFCQVASPGRKLVVETHSDHLLDRIRMEIRDAKTRLKPQDISILFFERSDLDVNIHSLRVDQEGNILNAPPSYGKFFLEETRRSLGL
jgi:hypothetical protein